MSWRVERFQEAPSASHARELPSPVTRTAWVFEPTGPALVLGSTQSPDVARPAADIEVVRRRSGGGAVLVVPGDVLWVDVIVPAGDPLWDDDIGRSFGWLGDTWRDALAEVGVATSVHRGALVRTRWSGLVCFAGLGPGELRDDAGRKVVGLSQRRTREAARFQSAVLARWDPAGVAGLLALPAVARDEIGPVAAGVDAPLDAVLEAFLRRLP